MRLKLLLLAVALSLAAAASSNAGIGPIPCGTCTTTNPGIPCRCEPNSLQPGYVSNCDVWPGACWNGFPP